MGATDTDVQWYIAREGKQHGPLSDAEMRKLLELGHLRGSDLLWCVGFPDWRPVNAVFPAPQAQMPEPTLRQPDPGAIQTATPTSRYERTQGAGAGGAKRSGSRAGSISADVEQRRWSQSARGYETEKSGKGKKAAIAAALLALVGGGGWLGYENRDQLLAAAGLAAPSAEPTAATEEAPPADAAAAEVETAAVSPSSGATSLDDDLQRRPLWSTLKQEFPDWYKTKVDEAAKLVAEGKPEADVTRHLVEALVAFRREHANAALAAGPERHRELAAAFLENLRRLSAESPDTCFGFISKGETSPAAVAMMQDAQKREPLEAQATAIVTAITEGKKSPVTHTSPVKADYDVLAAELGRLGWTQADMQLFADPKALAQAPHERVCKMVQDWFAAHLSIGDLQIQQRLLYETIRPVVAG